MIAILRNTTYAKMLSAQVVALLGTGLLTVALGLLAFDIAGGDAGIVVGIALTIKMVAYVAISPVMAALTVRVPRRATLIAADLARAAVATSLPFVTDAWQIYVLIFLLQSASATFTPTFQAIIPEILPDVRDYTRALSLSRLAYDLESLASPILAAVLLTVISYHDLFIGTVLGFLASAGLVVASRFPSTRPTPATPFFERVTQGARIYLRTAELRSLLAMNLVVATSTAMVMVNTVVLVQGGLSRPPGDVAFLLAAYGAGSMVVALSLPRVLDRVPDRRVMLVGAASLPIGLLATAALTAAPVTPSTWPLLLTDWLVLGAATSLVLTPSARLIRRASNDDNRPAVFAAQFSLSHACFMVTYPLAGIVGTAWGLWAAAATLSTLGIVAAVAAARSWRPRAHSTPIGDPPPAEGG